MYWTQTSAHVAPYVDWTLMVPWIIAFVALFVGPFIQLRIAKKQIESTAELAKQEISHASKRAHKEVVAPMRQAWINELRKSVAEFLSEAIAYSATAAINTYTAKDAQEIIKNLHTSMFKIELMLNPNEPDHIEFVQKTHSWIREHSKVAEWDSVKRSEMSARHAELIGLVGKILKAEWEVAKSGK